MGNESESLKSQVATLIRRCGPGNGYPPKAESRRMHRQETSEIQDEPRADLASFQFESDAFHRACAPASARLNRDVRRLPNQSTESLSGASTISTIPEKEG
jgi:hypothetical protein